MNSITRQGSELNIGATDLETKKKQLKDACEQFEAIFMQYLLKSMRQTVARAEDPEQAQEVYEAMMDESLAKEIAGHQSNGLAAMLYKQLLPALGDGDSQKP